MGESRPDAGDDQLDFQLLFESAPSSILVLDPDFFIVAVSQKYLEATMRARDELVGKAMFEAFPDNPDDPTATGVRNLRASLERVLQRGQTDTMPLQKYDIARPQSEGGGFEERYWSPKNSPVLVDGAVKYIIHRVEDVTDFIRMKGESMAPAEEIGRWRQKVEQLQAEVFAHSRSVEKANAQLRAAHEFSQALLASINDGFFCLDRDWRFVYVNEQQAAILAQPASLLVGKSVWDYFPEPDTGLLHQELGRAMNQRVPVEFEYFQDRSCQWFEIRAYPSSHGVSCLATNVTSRKRAIQRLSVAHSTAIILSNSRSFEEAWPQLLPVFCRILEAQVAGLWMLEPGGKRLSCVALHLCDNSPGAIRFTEASKNIRFLGGESLPGRVWAEGRALYISDLGSEHGIVRRALALNAGFRSAVAFPIRNGGEFFGVIEFFLKRVCRDDDSLLDITTSLGTEIAQFIQHKRAEKQLQEHAAGLELAVTDRTKELSETISELKAFSYSLSHDMRAPLRAIQGFTQAVLDSSGQKLGAEQADYLGKVVSAAKRLDRLIQDVLAFTRVSRMELPLGPVDLDRLLQGIIREHPEFNVPRAEIVVRSPLLPVRGHEAPLTQCLSNLLSNAVKFVARGVLPHLEIWTEPKGHNVRVWVEDNGIGIAQEAIPRLFQIFARLHTESEYEGTGIGLAIVRRAVHRMGGEVGVESEPDKGSRFWFQLPGAASL